MLNVEVRVRGQIDEHWSDWFEDLTLSYEEGVTVLTGPVQDQSALYGLLAKLRDLGLALVSVSSEECTPLNLPRTRGDGKRNAVK
jgi:hypothetical protein